VVIRASMIELVVISSYYKSTSVLQCSTHV